MVHSGMHASKNYKNGLVLLETNIKDMRKKTTVIHRFEGQYSRKCQ